MSYSPQIQFSTNYEAFKLFTSNRKISEMHVQKLVSDESFRKKYHISPIIVTEKMLIVDGQHRFEACKALNLPVFFIVDPNATEDDIRIRNMNQSPWRGQDFIDFYSNTSQDYLIIKNLRKRHGCAISIITAAIKKICSFRTMELSYKIRKGELVLSKNREKLVEFVDIYVPAISNATKIKGKPSTRPYYTESVIIGFCHHFLTNRKVFDRAIKKLPTSGYPFPFCGTYESARDAVSKLAIFNEKTNKK